jgi:hypothetical protein
MELLLVGDYWEFLQAIAIYLKQKTPDFSGVDD